MKRIIIIGSRQRNSNEDLIQVETCLQIIYKKGDILISGGCPKGGDRFAEIISEKLNIPIVIFPADWKRYGRGAGFIRNTDIAKNGDVLIACVASDRTGGTEDTIEKFNKFYPNNRVLLC